MYFHGWGTAVDYARAIQWLEKDEETEYVPPKGYQTFENALRLHRFADVNLEYFCDLQS